VNTKLPDDSKLHKTLEFTLRIIEEQDDKEKALKDLNEIRDVEIKYQSDLDKFLVHGIPPYSPRRIFSHVFFRELDL